MSSTDGKDAPASVPVTEASPQHTANDRLPEPASTDAEEVVVKEEESEEELVEVDIHDYSPGSDLLDCLIDLARHGDLEGLRSYFDSVVPHFTDAEDGGDGAEVTGGGGERWQAYRRSVLSQGDERDCTLLHYASANGHADTVRYILSAFITSSPSSSGTSSAETEADKAMRGVLDRQNDGGNTALHWACLNGHLSCVKLLADPMTQLYPTTTTGVHGKGKQPEHAAIADAGVPPVLATDTKLRNKARRTAMDEAEANKQEDIVLYLLALEMHREKLSGAYDDDKDTSEGVKGDSNDPGCSAETDDEVKVSAGTI